jgi:hypothetical protein
MKVVVVPALALAALVGSAAAHSNLIRPKPRNAIDSLLPEWSGGKAPYVWQGGPKPYHVPCVCKNGTEPCESAQTCLWMSVGCSIGCKECDGGAQGGTNPSSKDRCKSGAKATINDPLHRTINREAEAGSAADWSRWNPWRAPGTAREYDPSSVAVSLRRTFWCVSVTPQVPCFAAAVWDPCGRASGSFQATGGHGEFTNTTYAKLGDMGSKLPKFPSGAVWKTGSVVETMWSLRTNHVSHLAPLSAGPRGGSAHAEVDRAGWLAPSQGGGYQYRLCPLSYNLTEECFQQTPVPFANNSRLMLGDGNIITLNSTFVDPHTDATLPIGGVGAWQMNPMPGYVKYQAPDGWTYDKSHPRWFDPPCDDPNSLHPSSLSQGNCSGEWLTNITTYDYLRIPAHLKAGEYVLGFRCEFPPPPPPPHPAMHGWISFGPVFFSPWQSILIWR